MAQLELTDFLQSVFDHSFTDENGCKRNGRAKSRYLLAPLDLKAARFKCTNLVELLRCLTGVVATRYQDPPSAKSAIQRRAKIVTLQRKNQQVEEDRRLKEDLEEYETTLNALKSSDWIIRTFEDFLDLDDWPENDAAEEHELDKLVSRLKTSTHGSSLKVQLFANDQDEEDASDPEEESELNGPPAKKARFNTSGRS